MQLFLRLENLITQESGLISFLVVVDELAGPQRQVVSDELHDQRAVFVIDVFDVV